MSNRRSWLAVLIVVLLPSFATAASNCANQPGYDAIRRCNPTLNPIPIPGGLGLQQWNPCQCDWELVFNSNMAKLNIVGSSPAFNLITGGTNTTAAMICGDGCLIAPQTSTLGVIRASDLDCTVAPFNHCVSLGSETSGDFVDSLLNAGLTLSGGSGARSIGLNLLSTTSVGGLTSTNVSASGMEITSSGFTLLQGCADGDGLWWTDVAGTWSCHHFGAGSVTSITAGTGLTGGAITTSGTIGLNFTPNASACTGTDKLTWTGTALTCAQDQNTGGGGGSSITVNGTGNVGGSQITAADFNDVTAAGEPNTTDLNVKWPQPVNGRILARAFWIKASASPLTSDCTQSTHAGRLWVDTSTSPAPTVKVCTGSAWSALGGGGVSNVPNGVNNFDTPVWVSGAYALRTYDTNDFTVPISGTKIQIGPDFPHIGAYVESPSDFGDHIDMGAHTFVPPHGTSPPNLDCNASGHEGRAWVNTAGPQYQKLWICDGTGGWGQAGDVLSIGRNFGQTIKGGTGAGENLKLQSTASNTRGAVEVIDALQMDAGERLHVRFVATSISDIATTADRVIQFNVVSAGLTATLPSAASVAVGTVLTIRDGSGTLNNGTGVIITVQPQSGNIGNPSTGALGASVALRSNRASLTVYSDGAAWQVLAAVGTVS